MGESVKAVVGATYGLRSEQSASLETNALGKKNTGFAAMAWGEKDKDCQVRRSPQNTGGRCPMLETVTPWLSRYHKARMVVKWGEN